MQYISSDMSYRNKGGVTYGLSTFDQVYDYFVGDADNQKLQQMSSHLKKFNSNEVIVGKPQQRAAITTR